HRSRQGAAAAARPPSRRRGCRGSGAPSAKQADPELSGLMALRFPPPWSVEDIGGCFAVKASNGRPLIFIYYGDWGGRRSLARFLTRNAAHRVAAGIAKLPELLRRR